MSTTPIPPGSGSQSVIPVDNAEEKVEENKNQPKFKKMTSGGPGAGGMSLKERMAQKKIQQVDPQNNVTSQTGTSSEEPGTTGETE
ncbi:MAG: hypothetical protein ACR2PX_23535 [Endozoicomonas sp.]|uniref:hypothetical protein n=1 Tax=Endozoicomonas sp. TaxID=1892382 RepID=UPI003D9BEEE3